MREYLLTSGGSLTVLALTAAMPGQLPTLNSLYGEASPEITREVQKAP